MPGGNPGCGDVVTVYLKGAEDHEHIAGISYEGEGCTISMAASSMLMEQVVEGKLTMDEGPTLAVPAPRGPRPRPESG